jgi:hypothetical protein
MLKDEASGAVKILRQTSSAGTGSPPACELYSVRHNKKFIVTQKTAMQRRRKRERMQGLGRRQVENLADSQFFRVQPRIGRHERIQVHAIFARDGGGRFTGGDGMGA